MKPDLKPFAWLSAALATVTLLGSCSGDLPLTPERYEASDQLFSQLTDNLAQTPELDVIVEIDHSRLGVDAGSNMPPARVLLFSDPEFDAALLQKNPLVGVDLPFRVLAYEVEPGGASAVTYNSFAYLQSRYGLDDLPGLALAYGQSHDAVLSGIEANQQRRFESDAMQPDGIITMDSPFDFDTTLERVQAAIDAQGDTVNFGRVDFQERARQKGILIEPSTLILFGGPGPGAKAMSSAPTLGLDAFCQKFLVWEDEEGRVFLSFNDLLSVAERQGVDSSLPLRVINKRLESTFSSALNP